MAYSYPLREAAQLAEASYDPFRKDRSTRTRQKAMLSRLACEPLDQDDVQAILLDNGLLLIPGSNSIRDYLKFNLRVLNIGGKSYRVGDTVKEKGSSGTFWHQGFLRHAQVIYDWIEAKGVKPTYVIGHSLGAASTQILTMSWGINGVGFAAPRPVAQSGRVPNARRCLCFNRSDDTVCSVPPSFHHAGQVHEAKVRRSVIGLDHGMFLYREAVTDEQAARRLSTHWPPRV